MPIFGSKRHRENKTQQAFATLHGLEFSEEDAFGLTGLPFPVFTEGDECGCQDIVYGQYHGLNTWAFTLWTSEEDSNGGRAYAYYSAASAPLPADCPSIDIHAVSALTRAVRGVGLGGNAVPFESAEFNERFRVTSSEPQFATEVIPQDMIEWLLANGDDWHFEVNRNYILAYRRRDRHDEDLTAKSMDLVTGFYNHIPNVVASLHRLNLQPQMTPEQVYEMARARAVGFNPVTPGAGGAVPVAATTAAAIAAANPEVAAAFQQLRAMGIAVGTDTPVEMSAIQQTLVGGPQAGASWTPGRMTIHAIQELGGSPATGRMVQLDTDITPQGGQPFHVSQTAMVMPQHADRVVPGANLAVKIDPANPVVFTVVWDAT